MNVRFLPAALFGLGASLVVMAGACGGKVVVDVSGTGGNGGSGGASVVSSTSVTSVTVGPTTGTGSSCSCTQFCAAFDVCGFPQESCLVLCNASSPAERDCVCQMSACNLKACFNGTTTTTSTGAGGGIGNVCNDCANLSTQDACFAETEACETTTECIDVLDCHASCGFSPACMQKCDFQKPLGGGVFQKLIQCAVCKSCPMECFNDEVFHTYCLVP